MSFRSWSALTANTFIILCTSASGTTPSIDQSSDYYPFGSLFTENDLDKNKYLYNGKELNNEFFENYDYGARFYDAELGRRHVVDNKAEKYSSISPYIYAANNPVCLLDPDGNETEWYQSESGNTTWQKGSAAGITVNGESFRNIGKTYSVPMSGGGYMNYFQDMPITMTSSNANVNQLLAKNNEIYRNAMSMASSREMKSEIFMTRININRVESGKNVLLGTLAVPSVVLGGATFSTSFWAGKALISAGTQAIMNKGDIDVFDVVVGAFLSSGASAVLGGAVDWNPFRKTQNFNFVGGNKSIGQFGIDAGTGYAFGKLGDAKFSTINNYLQNEFEQGLFNTVTSTSFSFFSSGANKVIKNKLDE